jgi:malonyl-CoA O-methyltransferase
MREIAVAQNFSRAARDYNANAHVQAQVARELLSYSRCNAPKTILEPGCGTGLYTRMLLDSFPEVAVKAIDVSDVMIRVAQERIRSQRASFLCADAEAFATGRYDLITSNATFHWFRDLAHTMKSLYGMLDDGGVLTFSYFGPDTYRELQESLRHATGPSAKLACNSFLTAGEIRNLLDSAFRVCMVEEKEYQESFDSLRSLLDNIKLTGTRGAGSGPEIAWSRRLLRSLEDTYLDRFGTIRATYQVYMCRAEK